jgi:surface polysaccharide O-acyltransferase-like enzyme
MTWIKNARILAIFAVIFLHVAAGVVSTEPIGSHNWWIANFFDSLSRWCVPVFVMISGALLLNPKKQENLSEFYAKRISRILIPLISWTIIYCIWVYLGGVVKNDPVSMTFLLQSVLQGNPYYHMWFLYMIIFMYLFTPFFSKNNRKFFIL